MNILNKKFLKAELKITKKLKRKKKKKKVYLDNL